MKLLAHEMVVLGQIRSEEVCVSYSLYLNNCVPSKIRDRDGRDFPFNR